MLSYLITIITILSNIKRLMISDRRRWKSYTIVIKMILKLCGNLQCTIKGPFDCNNTICGFRKRFTKLYLLNQTTKPKPASVDKDYLQFSITIGRKMAASIWWQPYWNHWNHCSSVGGGFNSLRNRFHFTPNYSNQTRNRKPVWQIGLRFVTIKRPFKKQFFSVSLILICYRIQIVSPKV